MAVVLDLWCWISDVGSRGAKCGEGCLLCVRIACQLVAPRYRGSALARVRVSDTMRARSSCLRQWCVCFLGRAVHLSTPAAMGKSRRQVECETPCTCRRPGAPHCTPGSAVRMCGCRTPRRMLRVMAGVGVGRACVGLSAVRGHLSSLGHGESQPPVHDVRVSCVAAPRSVHCTPGVRGALRMWCVGRQGARCVRGCVGV